jgi:hypothetical protein
MMNKTLTKSIVAAWKRATKDDSNGKYQSKIQVPTTTGSKQRKPKPLWKAVVDPNLGKPYYYHRKTYKTSWTKPEELKNVKELSINATPVHNNQDNTDALSQSQVSTLW